MYTVWGIQSQNKASYGYFPKTSNVQERSQFIIVRITFSNYDVYDDENILKSKHRGHYCPGPLKGCLENSKH